MHASNAIEVAAKAERKSGQPFVIVCLALVSMNAQKFIAQQDIEGRTGMKRPSESYTCVSLPWRVLWMFFILIDNQGSGIQLS